MMRIAHVMFAAALFAAPAIAMAAQTSGGTGTSAEHHATTEGPGATHSMGSNGAKMGSTESHHSKGMTTSSNERQTNHLGTSAGNHTGSTKGMSRGTGATGSTSR